MNEPFYDPSDRPDDDLTREEFEAAMKQPIDAGGPALMNAAFKIHNMEQGTPEWLEARDGCLVTGSDMGPYLFGTDKKSAAARRKRILRLLRRQSGIPLDEWEIAKAEQEERAFKYNTAVQRGNAMEAEARAAYATHHGVAVHQVGFMTTLCGFYGLSPDGLILTREPEEGEDIAGLISHGHELKCPEPETHQAWLLDGVLPPEHADQVHGSMAMLGLTRWDFQSYCRGYPPLRLIVHRDAYTEKLAAGLEDMKREYYATRGKLAAIWETHLKEVAP